MDLAAVESGALAFSDSLARFGAGLLFLGASLYVLFRLAVLFPRLRGVGLLVAQWVFAGAVLLLTLSWLLGVLPVPVALSALGGLLVLLGVDVWRIGGALEDSQRDRLGSEDERQDDE